MKVYYSQSHEWVKITQEAVFIGISQYAASQLGDIVFIKLPQEKEYKQNEVISEIESVKAASDIMSPVSLKVLEVNSKLENEPEAVNNSAQDQGWIAKVELLNPEEIENLMDESRYKKFIENL